MGHGSLCRAACVSGADVQGCVSIGPLRGLCRAVHWALNRALCIGPYIWGPDLQGRARGAPL